MSTFCHGVASAQSLDKSGEIVDIKGLDITSLPKTGILNYEHKSDVPGQICGKILTAKKIFTKEDCDNENEAYFWNKTKNPFVYITAELLDDYCQSGRDVAGVLRYDNDKKDQNDNPILGFSVEGSEIPNSRGSNKEIVSRGIARKVTITSAPCNSQCLAELLEIAPKSQVKDDFDSIFKNAEEAITLFKSGEGVKIYETYLAKKEAEGPSQGGKPPKSPSAEYQGQGIQTGRTKAGESAFSHGHIAPYKFNPAEHQEGGEFHEHASVMAKNPKLQENKAGRMKMNANATASGGRRENRAALSLNDKSNIANQQGKQLFAKGEKICDLHKSKLEKSEPKGWSPPKVDKKNGAVHWQHPNHGYVSVVKQPTGEFHVKHHGGLAGLKGVKGVFTTSKEAGKHAKNYMSAVSNGTVAPPTSHKELKKAIEAGSYNAAPSTLTNGAAYQTESMSSKPVTTGAEDHNFQATKKKDWNKKANEEYDRWPHREKFEKFMAARMPHLAAGEIRAIGKLVSLKKSLDLDKAEDKTPHLGNHFLFSAENPMHPHKNELKMDHPKALAYLKNSGFNAHEVKGHYGSPETSIMVRGVSPKEAQNLHMFASRLGQDSSIYSNGKQHEMKFHHGSNKGKTVHGEGTVWHKEKPQDFYTTLPSGQHFTHNFNFDNEKKVVGIYKSEESVKELDSKSIKDIQKETAEKWADRAEEAYKKAIAEKSIKWLLDAIEYSHEAIEHSSLGEDLAVFEEIRAKLMPIHKKALELLAPGAVA